MEPATTFEVKHNYASGPGFHIDFGGDDLLMPIGDKQVLFEMHHHFGPIPLNKRTGECLRNIPSGFWDAFKRWELGGKLVVGNLCVLPKWCDACRKTGDEIRHIGGKHFEIIGPCKKCEGKRVVFL